VSGPIIGNKTETVNASLDNGVVIFTAANEYSGITTIDAGTLRIGDGGTTGTLGTNGVGDNSVLVFHRSDNQVIANQISGSGQLIQAGTADLKLTATNNLSGLTRADAGTITLAHNLALQNSPLDTDGHRHLRAGSGRHNPRDRRPSGHDRLGHRRSYANVTALTLNVSNGKTYTYAGILADGAAGMSLTKTGGGTQVLSGPNTYTGGTFLDGGALAIAQDSALGAESSALTFKRRNAADNRRHDLGRPAHFLAGAGAFSRTPEPR
jgi:autotransporter-associated beta strand protein